MTIYSEYSKITASSEDCFRLAINFDLTVNANDPRNARYLAPLADASEEEMAHSMADMIYSAIADESFSDATSQAEADAVYEQCLIDSRRMLLDHEYAELFHLDSDVALRERISAPSSGAH